LKIQEVNEGQDKLRGAKDQDESKKINIYRPLRPRESSFNPEASTILKSIEKGREILLEKSNSMLFSEIVINEVSTTFDEEWNHENPMN
jgi:hypothetical protein